MNRLPRLGAGPGVRGHMRPAECHVRVYCLSITENTTIRLVKTIDNICMIEHMLTDNVELSLHVPLA